jgi:two-component system KDP operon response regulator KdpE
VGDSGESVFRVGDLKVDLGARRVFVADREVRLTRTEYSLLALLVRHAGKVLTHRQLLKDVWGPASVDQPQYLRVYMGQLRHKLEQDPARPRYLLTETGVGYRLNAD